MSYPLLPRNRCRADDFDFGKILGDGSLSTVFMAKERATGRKVALKVFDRNHLRSNKKDADVTMEEHCLRRANHPCIIKLHASFRDSQAAYLALELCTGGELWAWCKDVGCPTQLARHYLLQVAEACSYLRDALIVHRDLKAENVLISERGVAKLCDFGTAKDLANPHVKGAGNQSFKKVLEDNVGTPNFMAPEVIRNKRSDFRSDMWSFGCMVFQVLTGLPPFHANHLAKVYKRALKGRLAFPSGIDSVAQDLVQRIVVHEPGARLGADDFEQLRRHAFFMAPIVDPTRPPTIGQRFEGAHHHPAPIQSLEELCLRAIGKNWENLSAKATAWAAQLNHAELREEAQATLRRFNEVVTLTAGKPPSSEGLPSSSSSEAD
mmetsp:Transcript_51661/g.102699  ORF Transcript_51661/g.102699 Transcript_51661/m.102699 type:complete len:379 (-) Transcript_51661:64-1200(-)